MKTEDVFLECVKAIAPTVLAQVYKERAEIDTYPSEMSLSTKQDFIEKVSDLAEWLVERYEEYRKTEEAIRNL